MSLVPSVKFNKPLPSIALAAGSFYIAQTLLGLWQPQQETFQSLSDYWIELFFVAALLCTLGGLVTIRHSHVGKAGKLFTVGLAIAVAGVSGLLISAAATLLLGQNALGLLFVIGLLATLLGNLLLGIAIVRAKVWPIWLGLLLILSWPLSVALAGLGGGLLVGLLWLAIAWDSKAVGQ